MAKILVADDNSNVQKTVALALGGLGVDVVSVNNGEAAVRKLADFSPDLILADIFMPVRNGYEVCEYVKKESRFAHVPVVLLVGAFDPLDEREAQRVGADGILKKPFVPPDPLITMVKTLLEKTLGERLVAVSVSKPTAVAAERSGRAAVAEEHSPDPEIADDTQTPQFPHPAAHVTSANGEYPVAFGQLLEPSAQDSSAPAAAVLEPVDNDLVLTSSRDANLGDPIFWRNDSPEPEPQALEDRKTLPPPSTFAPGSREKIPCLVERKPLCCKRLSRSKSSVRSRTRRNKPSWIQKRFFWIRRHKPRCTLNPVLRPTSLPILWNGWLRHRRNTSSKPWSLHPAGMNRFRMRPRPSSLSR